MTVSAPTFARSYDAALERLAALQARDARPEIRPDSGTLAMLHGGRTARTLLIFHGLTNGPLQFAELGRRFHEAGYNVLIPRLPGHGHADRLSRALADLTVPQVVATADEALGIAAGLGDEVQLAGISLGGGLAAWMAQQHPGARALLIAPMVGIHVIPQRLARPVGALVRRLPNRFIWWDPRSREAIEGPRHAYPQVPTRALAVGLWLGDDLLRRAATTPPATSSVAVATAWDDRAVNHGAITTLMRRWEQHGASVTRYRFGPDEVPPLAHDIIDPAQPWQRIDAVYPVLMRLLME